MACCVHVDVSAWTRKGMSTQLYAGMVPERCVDVHGSVLCASREDVSAKLDPHVA